MLPKRFERCRRITFPPSDKCTICRRVASRRSCSANVLLGSTICCEADHVPTQCVWLGRSFAKATARHKATPIAATMRPSRSPQKIRSTGNLPPLDIQKSVPVNHTRDLSKILVAAVRLHRYFESRGWYLLVTADFPPVQLLEPRHLFRPMLLVPVLPFRCVGWQAFVSNVTQGEEGPTSHLCGGLGIGG